MACQLSKVRRNEDVHGFVLAQSQLSVVLEATEYSNLVDYSVTACEDETAKTNHSAVLCCIDVADLLIDGLDVALAESAHLLGWLVVACFIAQAPSLEEVNGCSSLYCQASIPLHPQMLYRPAQFAA